MKRGLFLFSFLAEVRNVAVRKYNWTTSLFLVCMCLVIIANYFVFFLRGGILDNALPENDRHRKMDDYVRAIPEFNAFEFAYIVIRNPDESPLSANELSLVLKKTEEAKNVFGSVISIANIPFYREEDNILYSSPYITSDILADAESVNQSLDALRMNAGLWNIFIAETWAIIGIPLPNENEINFAWRIIEFIEQREIPWWERTIKSDIYPNDPRIALSGWVLGRWTIDQGLNKDMVSFPLLGILFGICFLKWWLGTWREAFIGTGVCILSGILITRGSIALLHFFYPAIHERVYTLLAPTNVIVQGFVCIHVFEAFREANGTTSYDKFINAGHVNNAILFIALMASFSFSCLFVYPVWQIREMAIISLVGVGTILIGSTIILPAVYLSVEQWLGPEEKKILASRAPTRRLGYLFPLALRISPQLSACVVLAIFTIAGLLFNTGYIVTNTSSQEYITGSFVERTYTFLENKGAGNDTLDFFIEKKKNSLYNIYDSEFLNDAWRFQNALREKTFTTWQQEKGFSDPVTFVNTGSVLDSVARISQESYGKSFLTYNEEAHDIFYFQMLGNLPEQIEKALWCPQGIRLTVAAILDNSAVQRTMVERIFQFAEDEYPQLNVISFGKNSLYPSVDTYIAGGQNRNVLLTLLGMFILYAGWIYICGRQYLSPIVGGIALLTPFMFAVGIMGCFMAIANVPLSMSTAPIFDLSVNAGADFSVYLLAIYFMECKKGKTPPEALFSALRLEGAVVLMDVILNTIAFAPLMASQFGPVRELGWMMMLLIMSCGVGVLIFLPSLFMAIIKTMHKEVSNDTKNSLDIGLSGKYAMR